MIGFLKGRSHNRLRTLLSSYIDGEVSSAESQEVEEHLATCGECRAELDSLRSTVSLISSLPELALPRSFVLTEAPAPARSTSPLVWTTRLATSAAALLLFALVLGDALGFVSQSTLAVQQTAEFSLPAFERASSAPAQPETFAQSSRISPAPPSAPAATAPAPAPAAPAASPTAAPALAAPAPAAPAPAPVAPAAQAQLAAEPVPTPEPSLDAPPVPEPALADVQSLAAPAPASAPSGEDSAIVRSDAIPAPSAIELPAEARSPDFETLASPQAGQTGDTPFFMAQQAATAEPLESAGAELPDASASGEDGAPTPVEETVAPDESAKRSEFIDLTIPTQNALLEATPEPQVLALPLRELQIAAAVILVLLGAASLLIARRNRLWPFSR